MQHHLITLHDKGMVQNNDIHHPVYQSLCCYSADYSDHKRLLSVLAWLNDQFMIYAYKMLHTYKSISLKVDINTNLQHCSSNYKCRNDMLLSKINHFRSKLIYSYQLYNQQHLSHKCTQGN